MVGVNLYSATMNDFQFVCNLGQSQRMKLFLAPNITRSGRILRAVIATALLIGGIIAITQLAWLGVVLFVISAFVFFEAARGWCVMRACGIKTRL